MAQFEIVDAKTVDQLANIDNFGTNSYFIGSEENNSTLKHIKYDTLSGYLYSDVSTELSVKFFDGQYYDKVEIDRISTELSSTISVSIENVQIKPASTSNIGGFKISNDLSAIVGTDGNYNYALTTINEFGYAVVKTDNLNDQIKTTETITSLTSDIGSLNRTANMLNNRCDNLENKFNNLNDIQEINGQLYTLNDVNTCAFGTIMRNNYLALYFPDTQTDDSTYFNNFISAFSSEPNNVLSILSDENSIDTNEYINRIENLTVSLNIMSSDRSNNISTQISAETLKGASSEDPQYISSKTVTIDLGSKDNQISSIKINGIDVLMLSSDYDYSTLSKIDGGLSNAIRFMPEDQWQLKFMYNVGYDLSIVNDNSDMIEAYAGDFDGIVNQDIEYLSSKIDNLSIELDNVLTVKVESNYNNINSLSDSTKLNASGTYANNTRKALSGCISNDLKAANFMLTSDFATVFSSTSANIFSKLSVDSSFINMLSTMLSNYFQTVTS